MAEEPTLPSLPKVSWDSHKQTFTNTRKRHFDGTSRQPLLSNSSDPAVFSSDDDPDVENYTNGRHRKKRYVGSWFQQMPTSSDSTFGEAVGLVPRPQRRLERQWDSGVWMGSDGSVEPDEESAIEKELPAKLDLPRSQNWRSTSPEDEEQEIIRTRIDLAIENGSQEVDLSSLGVTAIPDKIIARLAELTLVPSVDKDVPFEQANPKLGLFLYNNRLARAPGAAFNLEHLTYLSLRNNKISELPPSIGKLRNLRDLNVSFNRLRYLPGELLDLLKFPSVLETLIVHPNPFYQPEGVFFPNLEPLERRVEPPPIQSQYLSLIEGDKAVYFSPDGRPIEEIRQQLDMTQNPYIWRPVLMARSPVQYSDSRNTILSRFRLPCISSDDRPPPRGNKAKEPLTLETEDVSVLSTPSLPGRVSDGSSGLGNVPSLYELASKSASRAAQIWDLNSYLSPETPPCVARSLDRIMTQGSLNGNAGTLPCSICGRRVITPVAHWIEWWDIAAQQMQLQSRKLWKILPLSMNEGEFVIPFLKRGCSWNCIPKPMRYKQCAPGAVLFGYKPD
ncbi:hypothetical protein F4777DRAFT_6849 [Nemania sp. FL0916]|nr:hypothetical protein F4777DRAFT_6849 [Nemania sp. FL0916]